MKTQLTNNKTLIEYFESYRAWSTDNNKARWMVVLTIQGVPHQFYTNNKDDASRILNRVTTQVNKRFFNRLFLESKGPEYSLEFYRIARGTQGGTILRQVS